MTTHEKQLLINDLLALDKEATIKDYLGALRVKRVYTPETVIKFLQRRYCTPADVEIRYPAKKVYTKEGYRYIHSEPANQPEKLF